MSSHRGMPNGLFLSGSLVLLGVSLWFTIGSVSVMVDIHDKRERLPGAGAAVTADVVSWKSDRSPGRRVKLSYLYDGREYRPEIRCGCRSGPPATMRVFVDPREPAEFVAENKHTDDSLSIFNGPFNIPVGLFLAAVGGLFTWAAFGLIRQDRRETAKLELYREAKARA